MWISKPQNVYIATVDYHCFKRETACNVNFNLMKPTYLIQNRHCGRDFIWLEGHRLEFDHYHTWDHAHVVNIYSIVFLSSPCNGNL